MPRGPSDRQLRELREGFASLPERYLGAEPGFHATYRIDVSDSNDVWGVEVDHQTCEVIKDPGEQADVEIRTDTRTWLRLREGELSGLDAFRQHKLSAHGKLDLALAFEGLFTLPNGRPPRLEVREVEAAGKTISALSTGQGSEAVVLLHGLGSNKSSFFETVSALEPGHRVHAIDLPGFGSSEKPLRAPYDAPWFAESVLGAMDSLGVERAHLVGNSMGGRVAIEVGLQAPERARSLSLLAPSLAWRRRRQLSPLVRFARPELAAIPHFAPNRVVERQFWAMFARPDRIHPEMAEMACGEFVKGYRNASNRVALSSSARHIYLEEPFGPNGFWTRLADLSVPALFVWGDEDPLVPYAFARHVREALPNAEHLLLRECGHAPQVELPEETNAALKSFIARNSSSVAPRTMARMGRAVRGAVGSALPGSAAATS